MAIATLPVVPLALRLPGELTADHSIGDLASFEIGVLEAVQGERLLGQPARFGFHQLGPAHLWVQAPLYAAAHRQRFALSLTALLVNWGAFLTLLYALARWSDSSAAAIVVPVVAVGFLGYYESATLFNYWPQYQNVLPFAALVAVAAAGLSLRSAPLVLGLASYVVQGYGSVLPAAAAILLATAVGRLRCPPGESGESPRTRLLRGAATVAVLAAFWTPALLEELRHDPGNLARMAGHYRAQERAAPPGSVTAAAKIAPHLAGPWWHLAYGATVNTAPDPEQRRAALIFAAALVAALAATAAAASRVRRRWTATSCVLLLVAVGAAFASTRQSDGDIFPYVFFWLAGAAALGWIVVLGFWLDRAVAGRGAGRWLDRRRPQLYAAAALVLAAVLFLRPLPIPRLGDASVGELDRSLAAHLRDPRLTGRPVHLVSHDFAWPWALSLLAELAKRDVPVSIANVQGTTESSELQGLMPRWRRRRPGSVEVHLFDRDPGPVAGLTRLLCPPVLPLDASKPFVCMHASD